MGKQMTAMAGAPINIPNWSGIHWDQARKDVRRLQMRIAKATKEGQWGKVKSLQRLHTNSFYAKLLAVKRVTPNKGKKTPDIDGVLWRGARAKMQAVLSLHRRGYQPLPLRRIYIPKKNGKLRPLSIPCMTDRAMQALHKLALSPVAETVADRTVPFASRNATGRHHQPHTGKSDTRSAGASRSRSSPPSVSC